MSTSVSLTKGKSKSKESSPAAKRKISFGNWDNFIHRYRYDADLKEIQNAGVAHSALPTLEEEEEELLRANVKKQLQYEDRVGNHTFPNEQVPQLIQEYLRYMYLNLLAGKNVVLSTSPLVEIVWNTHILCTQQYREFCKRNWPGTKSFVDHDPSKGYDKKGRFVDETYRNTRKAYQFCFGTLPPTSIWPVDSSNMEVEDDSEEAEENGSGGSSASAGISLSPCF